MITEMIPYSKLDTDNVKLELTAKLDLCPFCGGEAKVQYAPGFYGLTGIKVKCTKCLISTLAVVIGCGVLRNGHFELVSEIEAFNKAVTSWNRRTTA